MDGKIKTRLSLLRQFALIMALALTVGCQSINHLREAQDAFNQAAREELTALADPQLTDANALATGPVLQWSKVRNLYGSALVSLAKIKGGEESELRTEKLWGAKMTLEALCHWKLGSYAKAEAAAKEAQATAAEQLYPRDRALLAALPGLIQNDYSYDLLVNTTPQSPQEKTNLFERVRPLLVGSEGAITIIEEARSASLVETNHPVHIYLIQCQLAAYRNYRKAYELIVRTGAPRDSEPHQSAQRHLDDLAGRLRGAGGQDIVNKWADRCNLTSRPVSGGTQ
jgi:hypothetical protein